METFSVLLDICAGNSPVPGEFPTQRPVTRSFVVFFDLHLNKRLSKQWWSWWFEMSSSPLWRHCNDFWDMETLLRVVSTLVYQWISAKQTQLQDVSSEVTFAFFTHVICHIGIVGIHVFEYVTDNMQICSNRLPYLLSLSGKLSIRLA